MRKKLSIGAVVAVPVILAAALAPAALSHDDGRGGQGFTLTSTFAQDGFIDVGVGEDPNPGDGYAFSDDLFRGGRAVGDRGGVCTLVRVEPARLAPPSVPRPTGCPTGRSRPRGSSPSTSRPAPRPYTLAVTGGTGAYRAVEGEVRTVESDGGANGTHTFRLAR